MLDNNRKNKTTVSTSNKWWHRRQPSRVAKKISGKYIIFLRKQDSVRIFRLRRFCSKNFLSESGLSFQCHRLTFTYKLGFVLCCECECWWRCKKWMKCDFDGSLNLWMCFVPLLHQQMRNWIETFMVAACYRRRCNCCWFLIRDYYWLLSAHKHTHRHTGHLPLSTPSLRAHPTYTFDDNFHAVIILSVARRNHHWITFQKWIRRNIV